MSRLFSLCLPVLLWLSPAAAQTTTFKIATIAPDGTTWMKELHAGADIINQRTGGRVQFRFFPGGVMGNDKSVLRKIRVGQLQGGVVTAGGLMDIAPNTQIYTLPLLFRSLDEVDYVRQRMDDNILKYILAQGFVSFGLSEGGFAYLMSNSPLTRTADLKGQKVWAPEGDRISRAAFESLGISPIPLPLSDVLTGLQTGLIDTVATSYTGAIALQWYTQVKYVTEMPLMYIYGTMIIDRNAFEKLDTSDQTVVREVMGGVFKKLNAESRSNNAEAYEALRKQGINFVQPSMDERQVWEAKINKAMQELADEGVFNPELLKTLRGYLADYRRQHSN
jgi:TRAP-type C4-dicarboxylate transport system substrate-binding protein